MRAILDDEYLAPPESGQRARTLSQIVFYYEGDLKVAVVHQYLLPDGTIGASGLPDPKWLRDGDTILTLESPTHPA